METLGTMDIVSGVDPVFLCVSDEELTVTFSLEHVLTSAAEKITQITAQLCLLTFRDQRQT